jgi:hypothetical protein
MRIAIAASWDLAARLADVGPPDVRVYETHPGGGQYDCLTLAGAQCHIDINRTGSIHVHRGAEIGPLDWRPRIGEPNGTAQLAEQIGTAFGWRMEQPTMTARSLTYRLLARALAARVFDDGTWDARAQTLDTADAGGGLRWPVPSPEMGRIPANQVWVLTRDDDPMSWLWDGWAWNARGDRTDLVSRFIDGGRIDELAAALTERVQAVAAPPLPTVPMHGEQPVGAWPS